MKKLLLAVLTATLTLSIVCFAGCKHECEYDQQVASETYLLSAATCTNPAVYRKSCKCGKINETVEETFEYGEPIGHSFTNYVSDNNSTAETIGTKTAVCNHGCGATDSITDDAITFKTCTFEGFTSTKIVRNSVTVFDFNEEIIINGNSEYLVCLDKNGFQTSKTNKAELTEGDNVFYILEYIKDEYSKTYMLTIHRNFMLTVSYDSCGGSSIESQTVEESFCATMPTDEPTRTGYTFDGWDYDFSTPITEHTTINAKWVTNNNTAYKVGYYLQNLENDNYTLTTIENKTGTTDTLATAEIKNFEHFTHESTAYESAYIKGNGSTVLRVYYTRNRYTVSVSAMNNKGTVSGAGKYANAQEVTVTAKLNAGYSFDGWYVENEKVSSNATYTFNPTDDITLLGKWLANTNTAYKVGYYLQNLENDNYTLTTTENKTGTTDTLATAEIKNFEHFTHKSTTYESGYINGNGSTVLKVYYTRNTYTVSVSAMNNKGTVSGAGKYANAQEVTVTAKLNAGYIFDGWYVENEKVSSNATYTFNPTDDITLLGKWSANTNTAYKVDYYLQNLENDNYTLTTTENKTGTTDTLATAEIKTFAHFTVKNNNITGNINGNGSTVLKVYYTRNKYTVTFDGNGGTLRSGSSTKTVKYGGSVTAPTFTKTGYTLDKWDKLLTNISEDQTITAEWKINQYTITVNFGNGQESKIITQDYNSEINYMLPTDIQRGGYTFNDYDKTMPTTMPANNMTITAIWLAIFKLNGSTIMYYYGNTFTEIVIPEKIDGVTITSIGEGAFDYGRNLTSVTIPNSVTSIGYEAFEYCSSLKSVYYTGTIDQWVQISFSSNDSNPLYYAENLYINNALVTEANITTAMKINAYAFYNCSSLTSVTIPNSVTSIGNFAFAGCDSLQYNEYDNAYYLGNDSNPYLCLIKAKSTDITGCTINENCKFIHSSAFNDCRSLKSITIPDSVTSISKSTFFNCYSLTSVTIPNSVTSIGYNAFYGCGSLKYNEYDNACYLGNNSNPYIVLIKAKSTDITGCTINENCKFIYSSAFSDCRSLKSITIPDSVTSIGSFAFYDCSSLKSVTIGNSVTSIGNSAFYDCDSLKSIIFNDTSTWYRTTNSSNWENKTNGTYTDVTNTSTNATYFKSTYYRHYWYKV